MKSVLEEGHLKAELEKAQSEIERLKKNCAEAHAHLDYTTIFHNGSQWVTSRIGDLPRFKNDEDAASHASAIEPPLQALSSMDSLEKKIAELQKELELERARK